MTWDNDDGIHGDNPTCNCGVVSRQAATNSPRLDFWICATELCDYKEDIRNQS